MDSDDSLLVKKCGGKGAGILKSSGNTMKVEFNSDHNIENRGFNATWKKVSEDVPEGLIASPNFPENYRNHFDEVRILECSD